MAETVIVADWPVPRNVQAITTTRSGGASTGPWASLNLATHCGDAPAAVAENRLRLRTGLALPAEPVWLEQVHGTRVVRVPAARLLQPADAVWTSEAGAVCAIMTADCLPVVFCDRGGSCVAVAHAGWRGLAAGVLEATLAALPVADAEILAWLGPCIGPTAFEVGAEVRASFCDMAAADAAAFAPAARAGHWYADLAGLARRRLQRAGVRGIHGGHWCTFSDPAHFYSYRRDGVTGRMATLAWLQATK
ncbi:MAG: peptidoglycan editing factor PgeF [Nevskiaceae bacterium]|nr:MAG: peptidoglycan editing factor PgeF [Nevskiaceae bacterium]TBR73745.1 MAG: peptidoglycan editing factor PgeF [Nevskiaceae bacterium]